MTLSQIIVFTLSLRCELFACREAPVSEPGFPKLVFLPLLVMEIIPAKGIPSCKEKDTRDN